MKISLAAARVNAGYTQKEVAKKLGISNATLLSWEKGKTLPNIEKTLHLCSIYNISPDDIFLSNSVT